MRVIHEPLEDYTDLDSFPYLSKRWVRKTHSIMGVRGNLPLMLSVAYL